MRAWWVWALVVTVAGSTGCTVVVAALTSAPPPCAAPSDCLAGTTCVEGACVAADEPGVPIAEPTTVVGPEGGTVVGEDGVTLVVPAGALGDPTGVSIRRVTATLAQANIQERTATYEVLPPVALLVPAELFVPVAGGCEGCLVFRRPPLASTFSPLAQSEVRTGGVAAAVGQLETYVVGVPLGGAPDGGIEDGGPPADGGLLDDGGAPGTLHAECFFGPADCAAGQVCYPDPFEPTRGRCLAPAGACGPGCACCRPLDDVPAAGALCLPDDLCGAGGLHASCVDGGVAACDPDEVDGCATPWMQTAQCTRRCSADDEIATCAGGCCLPDEDDPGRGLCAASCALPLGALCLTDASCSSGVCASPNPEEPARCTEPCNPGGCGDGLCCYPTDCAGDGLCVPDGQCLTDSLLCGTLCVDDSACAGGLCFEGTCLSPSACGCLEHEDCAADERCALDAAQAIQCAADPDGPCCGSCEALPAGTCYVDAHCAGLLPLSSCVADTDAGCAGDLEDPCPGTCVPLPAGGCLTDDECAPPRRCVDHECR